MGGFALSKCYLNILAFRRGFAKVDYVEIRHEREKMRHTDKRHEDFQKFILDTLAEEIKDTDHLNERLFNFFKNNEIKTFYEERTGIIYVCFTDEPENPQIVLGFGDVVKQDWDGLLQWGIYANEGHELGIWGETPLMSPAQTIKTMFIQINEILERAENGNN